MRVHSTVREQTVVWVEPGQFPKNHPAPPSMYDGVLMPRAGATMAAIIKSCGYNCIVLSGELTPLVPEEIAQLGAIVCISVLSNSAPYGLVLASQLRSLGCTVIMGGYHFAHQAMTESALRQTTAALRHCDYVIRGDGYTALPDLMVVLQYGLPQNLSSISGLSWTDAAGRVHHNRTADTHRPARSLPQPDWLAVRNREKILCIPVQAVSGCPRSCSWCAVTKQDGKSGPASRRDVEQVVEEIVAAQAALPNAVHLFVTADNLVVHVKWLMELCQAMIDRDIKLPWSCQAETPTLAAHPELAAKMAEAGCVRVCLGLESVSSQTLSDSDKAHNIEAMSAAVQTAHRYGMAVHGMFIVGLPGDDETAAEAAVAWSDRHRVETTQFLCLLDLPGSALTEEKGLYAQAYKPFAASLEQLSWLFVNGHYARLASPQMSLQQVQRTSIETMGRCYSLRRVIGALLQPQGYVYRAARRRGHRTISSLGQMIWAQIVTAALRWRGYTSIRSWRRHPTSIAYCNLIAAQTAGERMQAYRQLIDSLPTGWVDTFTAVHINATATATKEAVG